MDRKRLTAKIRRTRINKCIEELKDIMKQCNPNLLDTNEKLQTKVEVLQTAVNYMRNVSPCCLHHALPSISSLPSVFMGLESMENQRAHTNNSVERFNSTLRFLL